MPQQLISNINGIDIVTVNSIGVVYDLTTYTQTYSEATVPLRGIVAIDEKYVFDQRLRVNADKLPKPVAAIITATGSDGKKYEFCASTTAIIAAVEADDKERGIRRARLNELLLECYNKAKAHKDTRTMERVSEAYGKLNPQIRFIP